MNCYKIKIKSSSPFLTPWQADTIFGHFCWALLREEGEQALKEFLEPFLAGEPPFLISNGFPEDLLPIPLTAFQLLPEEDSKLKKKVKKIAYIDLKNFEIIGNAQRWKPDIKKLEDPFLYFTTPHASISRLTNTTSEGGQLFELQEYTLKKEYNYLSIYLKIRPDWEKRLEMLFKVIEQTGYGAKKTVGKGHIKYLGMEEFKFPEIKNPDGFISLSNFVPASNDPIQGCYKLLVKYGKLGEELAKSGNPFKKPLIMLQAGACFFTNGNPKECYGRMVKDMDYLNLGVVQYGYAFAVPIKMPEPIT